MDTRSRLDNALARADVPELARQRLRPMTGPDGRPIIVGGDKAVVVRMTRSDGSLRALRIPLSPDSGQEWERHYAAIGETLPSDVASRLPAEINIMAGGITLGNRAYPAVTMQWIEGPTLLEATDRAARSGNGMVLLALAEALKGISEALRQAHVVHGDPAPDNLIVRRDGDLVAVDLDTVSWRDGPASMSGEQSLAYRFPGRNASGAQGDAFAVLVQYVSIMALADAPDLRRTYGDPPSTHGGAILFSSWDLADPTSSRTFADVRDRVGVETRRHVDRLSEACLGEASGVPEIFASVMNVEPLSDRASGSWASGETTPPGAVSGWDLSHVIDRMKSQEAPFKQSVRMRAPEVSSASEDVLENRARLREAIATGNDTEVLQYAGRLADDPVAQLYKIDVERVLAVGYQRRIAEAARQDRDDVVVTLADEVEARQLPLSQVSRRAVRKARERVDVRGKLQRALDANDRLILADLAVSGELVVLGDTDRASLQRVLQALEWPNMQRALETDDDTLILEAFDDELFGDRAALPAAVRERVQLAQDRVPWVVNVRAALRARDVDALGLLFSSRPSGGMGKLSAAERKRVDRMIQQRAALDGLGQAMRTGNDPRILTALHEVERVGARIEDRLTWSAVRDVVERASLVERILDAASTTPVDDRQLAHLLPVAKTMGLMHDPAFHDDYSWDRLEAIVVRGAAIRRIRRALATDDDLVIRQAAFPDVSGAIDLLTDEERDRVEAARERRT